jgi:hypothetical protein
MVRKKAMRALKKPREAARELLAWVGGVAVSGAACLAGLLASVLVLSAASVPLTATPPTHARSSRAASRGFLSARIAFFLTIHKAVKRAHARSAAPQRGRSATKVANATSAVIRAVISGMRPYGLFA